MLIASLKRYIVTGTLPLLALTIAPFASGQSAEVKAGARSAANEGLKAFEAGNYELAIDRFERANELIRAPTHALFLARAHAKLGHLVLARELYIELDRERLADDAPPPFVQAQQDARAELEALEPRVPRITVEVVGPGDEGAEVTMDDKPVPSALIGLERPVDPGKHKFRASSGEAKARPVTINVKEGDRKTVSLELRTLATTELPDDPVEPDPDTNSVDDESGMSGMTIAGISALGIGVVGLGMGGYFTSEKSDFEGEADDLFSACNPRVCTDGERSRIDDIDADATSASNMAMAGFIVGGLGVVSGVTLLLLAPSGDEPATESVATMHPWIGLGSAGVSGTF
jgi:hypothetical protein